MGEGREGDGRGADGDGCLGRLGVFLHVVLLVTACNPALLCTCFLLARFLFAFEGGRFVPGFVMEAPSHLAEARLAAGCWTGTCRDAFDSGIM